MTVTSSNIISGPYLGNGISQRFKIGYRFLDNTHVVVEKKATDGTKITLEADIDYTVSGAGEDTGEIKLATPLPVNEEVTITRIVPISQLAEYVQGDPFPAKSHENALDKLTMIAQQQQTKIENAVVAPLGNGKNSLLGFDSDGSAQYVKISDGLTKEKDLLKVKEGVGILSNAQGVSVLLGDGLGTYDKAITVQLGNGLEFDAQTRVAIKEALTQAITNIQGDIIDLKGLIANLANRVGIIEQQGGGTVTITIGNGLRYDEYGAISIRPNVGIKVTANGVSIMLGKGLEIDEEGNVQISDEIKQKIENMATSLATKIDEEKVNEIFANRYTIIYPNGGSKDAPAIVAANSRYLNVNPFPGKKVMCLAEVFHNGGWFNTGFGTYVPMNSVGPSIGYGVVSSQGGESIITQTGSRGVIGSGSITGGGSGGISDIPSAQCRVHVWSVD